MNWGPDPSDPSDRPDTPLLDSVLGPQDVRLLEPGRVPQLAAETRDFLLASVPSTDARLGADLGVVELAIALHRVFESPRDPVLWDTGRQARVHGLFAGRKDSGRAECKQHHVHDVIENPRASTALSHADGLARAFRSAGRDDRRVVAVVGDGALTGGMAWEALNSIAAAGDLRIVVVLNDNGRSGASARGALADHLGTLRVTRGYERFLDAGDEILRRTPVVGGPLHGALRGARKGLKGLIAPQGLFEDLGLTYVGPVDGHSVPDLEKALRRATAYGGPVVVHCVTRRGKGQRHAHTGTGGAGRPHADDGVRPVPAGRVRPAPHGPAPCVPGGPPAPAWTSVFAEEMLKVGTDRPDVVAVTAGMPRPAGLGPFAETYPERVFDVGRAGQHAVASAAGLAAGGLRPVVALPARLLGRVFDQVLQDVTPHVLGVTFVLGEAGAGGGDDGDGDGASHHAMGDLALLQCVPGLRLAAPRDAARLRAQLRQALQVSDAPTVVRFPPGAAGPDIEAVAYDGGVDVLHRGPGCDVLVVSVGAMAPACLEAARIMEAEGVSATVVDPCWVQPPDPALTRLAAGHRLVVTVEDGSGAGGVGTALVQELNDARVAVPVLRTALGSTCWGHAARDEALAASGLTGPDIARAALARLKEEEE